MIMCMYTSKGCRSLSKFMCAVHCDLLFSKIDYSNFVQLKDLIIFQIIITTIDYLKNHLNLEDSSINLCTETIIVFIFFYVKGDYRYHIKVN